MAVVEADAVRLTLKEICIYVDNGPSISGVTKDLIRAREQLVDDARRWGFRELRLQGKRASNSTSATPGRQVDILISIEPKP